MPKNVIGEPIAPVVMNEVDQIPSVEDQSGKSPEYNLDDWIEKMVGEVEGILDNQERAVISLAGASASGKGEASDRLKGALEAKGIKTAVYSTDNFYKGISRMITQKIPEHLELEEVKDIDLKDLSDYIRSVIGKLKFADKFSDENLEKIRSYVAAKYPELADKILAAIDFEKDHLDFDNPQVVDLPAVAESIDKLKNGESVDIPNYSMKISEQDGATEIDGAEIKAIIVEGLYGLDETVLGNSDIRSFIEAEIKTLLMRRMRRDVLQGRSSFPPEMNLWITLEIVLPAYYKYILPTKENADSVLANTYTEAEVKDTEFYDVQDKLKLEENDQAKIEALCGAPESELKQEDYYFTNEVLGHDPKQLIRVRVENGAIKNLIHKGTKETREDGRIIRPTEEYIKTGEFGERYQDPAKLAEAFKGAGFSLVKKLDKHRSVYNYEGVEITVDEITDLGTFVEFRANNKLSHEPVIDEIKTKLDLINRTPVGPYIDEALAHDQEIAE